MVDDRVVGALAALSSLEKKEKKTKKLNPTYKVRYGKKWKSIKKRRKIQARSRKKNRRRT